MATKEEIEKSLDSITTPNGVNESTPTLADKQFIHLYQDQGYNRVEAFMLAFPNNKRVSEYTNALDKVKKSKDITKFDIGFLERNLRREANNYFNRTRIRQTMEQYKERMTIAAEDALDIGRDLMINARSEMVRADLVKHFMNHEVGTPVQKHAIQSVKTVRISVGSPDKVRETVEGVILEKEELE